MSTLVLKHLHKAVQAPIIEDGAMQGARPLVVGFGDHLPLGEIANHHGAFNQSASDDR